MAKLFPQRGRLNSLGAVLEHCPPALARKPKPALAGKPKLTQRGCRLDTMGLCSDPAGFTTIDLVYDFLRLLFLIKDGLVTYI